MWKNARFNHFVNDSIVVLTVVPGEEINWHKFRYTDEGFNKEEIKIKHMGEYLQLEEYTYSRDCDGTLETGRTLTCDINKLGSKLNFYGDKMPGWEELEPNLQRDHYSVYRYY